MLDFRGYEVIRTQFFASAKIISVSFSPSGIRFSRECIRRLNKCKYIELQVHPFNHNLIVIPSPKSNKLKICWASIKEDKINSYTIGGAAFLSTLYELFEWDTDKRYRLRGEVTKNGDELMIVFDVKKPEIFISRNDKIMPWASGFGEDYYNYRKSWLSGITDDDKFKEFNVEADLHPTKEKIINRNVRILIENMINERKSSDDINIDD